MKTLRILFVVVAPLLGLAAVVGLLLPRSLEVERSETIAAAPAEVYALVAGFGRYNEWSPWADLDPHAGFVLSGPATGPGARMEWSSRQPRVGSGSQQIIAVDPPYAVRVRLVFDGGREARSSLRLAPAAAGTRVTWHFDMDLGMNPATRWIGLLVDGSIGADYEQGLARLKALAETEAAARAAALAEAAAQAADDSDPVPD